MFGNVSEEEACYFLYALDKQQLDYTLSVAAILIHIILIVSFVLLSQLPWSCSIEKFTNMLTNLIPTIRTELISTLLQEMFKRIDSSLCNYFFLYFLDEMTKSLDERRNYLFQLCHVFVEERDERM